MQYWDFRRALLWGPAIVWLVFVWALMGCDDDDDTTAISGLVGLAAEDGAALEGLTFDFPEATIFNFPGESATLAIGDNATTFTLTTSGGTVINGTITNGAGTIVACRLTQNPGEVGVGQQQFDVEYNTCQGTVKSDGEIAFGGSGAGTVILSIGKAGETPVASASEDATLHLSEVGTVTINDNARPI
jgi:hypothetical protein